jgi:hypothetical protein
LPVYELEHAPREFWPHEFCFIPTKVGGDAPPYSPLDFMVATALAFWHARRRGDEGRPVATARFPQPLSLNGFDQWPKATVPVHCEKALQDGGIPLDAIQGRAQPVAGPDGYALFNEPVVARRAPSPPPVPPEASTLLCDVTVPVRAVDRGDIDTGISLFPGHEIQIDASGDIWAGALTDPRNGPEGLSRLIDDARWPLHTGIDPAANAFCLLGRLNGYFRIGAGLSRLRWRYRSERRLFLRVNDDGPGDGNGQFDVRIRVWGPSDGTGTGTDADARAIPAGASFLAPLLLSDEAPPRAAAALCSLLL